MSCWICDIATSPARHIVPFSTVTCGEYYYIRFSVFCQCSTTASTQISRFVMPALWYFDFPTLSRLSNCDCNRLRALLYQIPVYLSTLHNGIDTNLPIASSWYCDILTSSTRHIVPVSTATCGEQYYIRFSVFCQWSSGSLARILQKCLAVFVTFRLPKPITSFKLRL